MQKGLIVAWAVKALEKIPRPRPWQILLLSSALAAAVSHILEWLYLLNSDHYALPILCAIWILWASWSILPRHFKLGHVLQPFPSWNLFLFLIGLMLLAYPFSLTLQNVGLVPLFILAALADVLFYVTKEHGLHLGTVTAGAGLLIFLWLWELAGTPDLVVLPVDVPEIQNAQFTSEGVTNAVLHSIESFSKQEPSPTPTRPQALEREKKRFVVTNLSSIKSFSLASRRRPFLDLQQEALTDVPHIIGKAGLGGVNLEPVYHTLRHLRHKPTVEAQILIGTDGSLTLGLRRSDFRSVCFAEDLSDRLLDRMRKGFKVSREDAFQEIERMVQEDITNERSKETALRAECNASWTQHLLSLLGISEIPGAAEERIGYATSAGLRSSEQLTQLIQRAVLEGMAKMSPGLLGYYYEIIGKPESALYYYRQALPLAVQDASRSRGNQIALARRRVVYLLVAIAELEVKPKKHLDEDSTTSAKKAFETAAAHYDAAVRLLPDEPLPRSLEGFFLLTNTAELFRDGVLTQFEAEQNYKKAETDFQIAIASSAARKLESEFGKDKTIEFLSFAHENLAAALTLQVEIDSDEDNRREKQLADADMHLDTAKNLKSEHQQLELPNDDPEKFDAAMLTTRARIRLLQGKCKEGLEKFGQAFDLSKDIWFYGTLVLGGYRQALIRCGDDIEKEMIMPAEILLHISVAYEHYRRGRIEKAVADLLTALTDTQKNKGDSPDVRALRYKLHAILLSAYGSLLQERFCFPQRFIDDGPRGPDKKVRDKLRKDAISALEESRAAKYEGWEYKDDGWGSTGLLANLLASSPETDFQTLARALMDVRQALAERPSDVEARLALAALQLRQGELPHALESYEISAILSPLDPRVHYLLGFSMMQNRAELERAIDERKSARDLDPANWDYLGDPLPGCMPIVGWARIQEPPSPNPRVDSRNPRVN